LAAQLSLNARSANKFVGGRVTVTTEWIRPIISSRRAGESAVNAAPDPVPHTPPDIEYAARP
jgi:hypothetical protein